MKAKTYLVERQIAWAVRHDIRLMRSPDRQDSVEEFDGNENRTAYTTTLADNLFEPMSEDAKADFQAGDGGELGEKMQALYSSSALGCNLFHHLRKPEHQSCLLDALKIPNKAVVAIRFEQKRQVMENPRSQGFSRDPNLDLVIRFESPGHLETAVECKFREPWSGKPQGIKAKYLQTETFWSELPNLNAYALEIGTAKQDQINQHLHAGQLLKHLLGLRYANRQGGHDSFELVYLFYDVPGEEGAKHLRELTNFARVVQADGIRFRWIACQEFIVRLLRHRSRFPAFVDYLTERYL
jgi:hypothetical protein